MPHEGTHNYSTLESLFCLTVQIFPLRCKSDRLLEAKPHTLYSPNSVNHFTRLLILIFRILQARRNCDILDEPVSYSEKHIGLSLDTAALYTHDYFCVFYLPSCTDRYVLLNILSFTIPQTAGRWEAQPANAFMLGPELSKQWMKNGLTWDANCQLLSSTSVSYCRSSTNRFTWTVGDLKLHLKLSKILLIADWWLGPRGAHHIMHNGPKSIFPQHHCWKLTSFKMVDIQNPRKSSFQSNNICEVHKRDSIWSNYYVPCREPSGSQLAQSVLYNPKS